MTVRFPSTEPSARPTRWLLVVPLVVLLGGYLAAMAYLMLNERAFVYHPDEYGGRAMQEPAADLAVEATRVRNGDGLELVTWLMPAPDSATGLGLWVLVCHGNAGNISTPLRQQWARAMRAQGVGVVSFDYRGFGASDDGALDEEALYGDARSVYDWMVTTRGIAPQRIVIYGHSLGSGVATHLAADVEAAGLIVEGAYTTVPDVGALRFPWVPVRLIARDRFASVERMDSIAMPKLHLHATDDAAIPFALGERLFAAAPAPKEFVALTGGHDRAFEADSASYFGAVARWLRTISARDAESALPTQVPAQPSTQPSVPLPPQ